MEYAYEQHRAVSRVAFCAAILFHAMFFLLLYWCFQAGFIFFQNPSDTVNKPFSLYDSSMRVSVQYIRPPVPIDLNVHATPNKDAQAVAENTCKKEAHNTQVSVTPVGNATSSVSLGEVPSPISAGALDQRSVADQVRKGEHQPLVPVVNESAGMPIAQSTHGNRKKNVHKGGGAQKKLSLASLTRGFMKYVKENGLNQVSLGGCEVHYPTRVNKALSPQEGYARTFYYEQLMSFVGQLTHDTPYHRILPAGTFVQIVVVLSASGDIISTSILQSSGYPDYDQHALATVRSGDMRYPLIPRIMNFTQLTLTIKFYCGIDNKDLLALRKYYARDRNIVAS